MVQWADTHLTWGLAALMRSWVAVTVVRLARGRSHGRTAPWEAGWLGQAYSRSGHCSEQLESRTRLFLNRAT